MNNLRPTRLNDIVGQEKVVDRLRIAVGGAKAQSRHMPHSLFFGPAGLGKTTLAGAVANELGTNLLVANGGNLTSIKSVLPYLMKLTDNCVLFIDEIHRLQIKVEEFLYPCVEDFRVDIPSDKGFSMTLPKFTLIGATTEAGSLSKPLFDRFTYKFRLELYNESDLASIIQSSAGKMGLTIENSAAINLARRSRGTPRIANSLITWVRDYILSKGSSFVSNAVVDEAVGMMGIDTNGVTEQDRAYMEALRKSGKPMGLRTIADSTGIDENTIRNTIEPFLLKLNKIQRTTKGRVLV